MDREAWRAIVHGVADSRTRLKRLSTQMEAPSKHSIKTGYYYPAGTHGAAPFSFLLLTGLQTSASRYPPKSRASILLSGELTVCSCRQRLCPPASNLPPHAHKTAAGDPAAGVGGRGQDALAVSLEPPAVPRRPASQLTPARLAAPQNDPPRFPCSCAGGVRNPVSYPSFLDPRVPTPARRNI